MSDPVDTEALRARADDDEALGYTEAAALQRAAADEVDRLRAELVEVQDDAENGWRVAGQWERTASDVKAAADAFLDERNSLRTLIENAPHAYECFADFAPGSECACWKADAL